MKITRFAEGSYIIAILIMASGAAIMAKADLGVSIVVAPAYILYLKFDFLTYGRAEYLVQFILLIIFCITIKRFHWSYLLSFVTAIIYGSILDGFMSLFSRYNINNLMEQIIYFIIGLLLTSAGVALFFRTYCPPEVYELFVKGISKKFGISTTKFKIIYDVTSCILSIVLSLILLGALEGIGPGTIVCAFFNGLLIGLFGKIYDRYIDFSPRYSKVYNFIEDKRGNEYE